MARSQHNSQHKINSTADRLTLKAAVWIDRAAQILKFASTRTSNPEQARRLLRLSDSAAQAAESFRPVIRSLRRTA